MIEYLPWSDYEMSKSLSFFRQGVYSIIDIELGGACNLSCIYCDTCGPVTECQLNLEIIEKIIQSTKIRWLYICGLGEPTVQSNRNKLIDLIELCEKHQIRCSMFTNLVNLDDELTHYIKKGTLYILFKLDSFRKERMKHLYQTDRPETILENIEKIGKLVVTKENLTNIAASIVPTSVNKDEILDIVKYCAANKIFPFIGDLEKSGRSKNNFTELKIKNDELVLIKQEINGYINANYRVPICPSVISGIHISHDGKLVVDYETGLSCHWFWLEEPNIMALANIDSLESYETITSKINRYRVGRVNVVKDYIKKLSELPFGGCGGDVKEMLSMYSRIPL